MRKTLIQIYEIAYCLRELGNKDIDGGSAQKISLLLTDEIERIAKSFDIAKSALIKEMTRINEITKREELDQAGFNERLLSTGSEEFEIKDVVKVKIELAKNPGFKIPPNHFRVLSDFIEIV